jgi:hypothetical protein
MNATANASATRQPLTANEPESGTLRLRHEPAGYRHYLCSKDIHCGQGLEALIEGVWTSVRYECCLTRDNHQPIFHLRGGRTMVPDLEMLCRWPSGLIPPEPPEPIEQRPARQAPAALVSALEQRRGSYSDMVTIFHCIQLDNRWVGVAGDGANGSYEHFVFNEDSGKLTCSDCGYGSTSYALLEILNAEVT